MEDIIILKPDSMKLKGPIVNCGIYAPQMNNFPSIGGSGPEQSIQINDAFILTNKMFIENKIIPPYTIVVSLVDKPTQDINDWLLLEGGTLKRQNIDDYINPSIFTRFKNFVSKIFSQQQH